MILPNVWPNCHGFLHSQTVSRKEAALLSASATQFAQACFHGTRADLYAGDLITVGHKSNFTAVQPLSWIYYATVLDATIWGTELAQGSIPERICMVNPAGPILDGANLNDQKFFRQPDSILPLS